MSEYKSLVDIIDLELDQPPDYIPYEMRIPNIGPVTVNLRPITKNSDMELFRDCVNKLQKRVDQSLPNWSGKSTEDLLIISMLHVFGYGEQYRSLKSCMVLNDKVGVYLLTVCHMFMNSIIASVTDEALEEAIEIEKDNLFPIIELDE